MSNSSSSYMNLLNEELPGFPKLWSTHDFPLSQWVYSNVQPIKGKESPILYQKSKAKS